MRIRDFMHETYITLRWLLLTRIPALIRAARDAVVRWASSAIHTVDQAIRRVIATLDKWAKQAVASVTNALRQFRDWALGRINALIADAARLIRRVFGDWSTPAKLATWLIGAIWTAGLRLLYGQRDRIATWFLRTSTSFTLWLARSLESVIGRLM
jgi:hypothetical protein